jgi:cytochrome c oxidase assembly protein Cox11
MMYVTGEVIERLVEVEHQTQRYAVPYTVDVLAQSTLEVQPGETVNLVFNVTNHHSQLAHLTFTYQVKDYPYIPPQLFIRPLV